MTSFNSTPDEPEKLAGNGSKSPNYKALRLYRKTFLRASQADVSSTKTRQKRYRIISCIGNKPHYQPVNKLDWSRVANTLLFLASGQGKAAQTGKGTEIPNLPHRELSSMS